MEFLPRTMGSRPRVAVELYPKGIVAARAEGVGGPLAAVSRGDLREGVLKPGLRAGNVTDRAAVSAAVRRAVDAVAARGAERSKYVTLIVPDAAVRVLLLDFDALPGKPAEALAVVRFRLKKLLPFDAEHAVVSYQVMSSGRDTVRVLAVAMPCDVLAEYEALVTETGYVPGAVLPSTLASLAGLEGDGVSTGASLVVNAGPGSVTTAIVRGGVLLLHRTVDIGGEPRGEAIATETESGVAGTDNQRGRGLASQGEPLASGSANFDRMDAEARMRSEVLRGETYSAIPSEANEAVQLLNAAEPVSAGREITEAVSVAAAYFEDTLGGMPSMVLAAGTLGAERVAEILAMYGMDGLRVREMVDASAIGPGASTQTVPRGWLAGVRGALKS